MAASISFFLTQPQKAQSSVRAEVKYTLNALSFHDSRAFYGEPIRITFTLKGWAIAPSDFAAQRVRPRAINARMINERLALLESRLQTLHARFVADGHFPTPERFKIMLLTGEDAVTVERDVLSDFDAYIETLANQGASAKYLADCRLTRRRLAALIKTRRMAAVYAEMGTPTLSAFERALRDHPRINRQNTVAKYMERLKSFLSFAYREGWTDNDRHRLYSVPEETNPFPVTLTDEEVQRIADADLSFFAPRRRVYAEQTRDLFVLATQTGARFQDWHVCTVAAVEGGYNLRMTQQKTLHPLEIPLSALAVGVLRKYNFALPRPLGMNAVLQYLDEIAQAVGIQKHITTHTARRTCATILERAGVPRQYIMRVTGHKTEKSYLRYVGVTFAENADLVRKYLPERFRVA